MGASSSRKQVACFSVGEVDYALDIMRVREVIRPTALLKVPKAPAFVEGILELRGKFLPVVDLRKRFGTETSADGKIMVVTLDGRPVGLIVDRVTEVTRVSEEDFQEAPPMAVAPESRFFSALIKSGDRVLLMVDLDAVLAPDERGELRGFEASPPE